MATLKDLIRRTSRLADDDFDNIDLIDWFNQCQSEALSPILYIPARADLVKMPSGLYTLPSDFKSDLVLTNTTSTYDIFSNELILNGTSPSVLSVQYNRFPARITTSMEQVPDIPEQFHDLYVFYGCMMAMLADEEHERYMHFREQFLLAYQGLKKYMDTVKSRSSGTRVDTWVVIR